MASVVQSVSGIKRHIRKGGKQNFDTMVAVETMMDHLNVVRGELISWGGMGQLCFTVKYHAQRQLCATDVE